MADKEEGKLDLENQPRKTYKKFVKKDKMHIRKQTQSKIVLRSSMSSGNLQVQTQCSL